MRENSIPLNYLFLLGLNENHLCKLIQIDGNTYYEIAGNVNLEQHVKDVLPLNKATCIVWPVSFKYSLVRPDIIVNCMADGDFVYNSLRNGEEVINNIRKSLAHLPVFNHPAHIHNTTRNRIYKLFHKLPGIYIPKTIRFRPSSTADVVKTAKAEGFAYPFIVRRCGGHEGMNIELIEGEDQQSKLEKFAYDGGEYYLIEYKEYKNAAGLYSKARLVIIDGKIYPRHYVTSNKWIVNATSRDILMKENAILKREEQYFLENFERLISREALASIREIYCHLKLDYLGYDFTLLPDGSVIIFEINAAQNALAASDYTHYPYLEKYVTALVEGFNTTIRTKALHHRAMRAVPSLQITPECHA